MPNLKCQDSLWFLDNCLIIPNAGQLWETLFHLAHDNLGHFGFDKSYKALRHSYFWPRMHKELETAYILSCVECQRNKSTTKKPLGPLHPLPVPDSCCGSVEIDFIGPLPPDNGFNCIATFTDCLESNVQLVPCSTSLTAEELAKLFFMRWLLHFVDYRRCGKRDFGQFLFLPPPRFIKRFTICFILCFIICFTCCFASNILPSLCFIQQHLSSYLPGLLHETFLHVSHIYNSRLQIYKLVELRQYFFSSHFVIIPSIYKVLPLLLAILLCEHFGSRLSNVLL
jgi:hypothetical protein